MIRQTGWRARHSSSPCARSDARSGAHLGIHLDAELVEEISRGFENDDAYDAFVGLLGMLNVVQGFRAEAPAMDDVVFRVEGWMLGRE